MEEERRGDSLDWLIEDVDGPEEIHREEAEVCGCVVLSTGEHLTQATSFVSKLD